MTRSEAISLIRRYKRDMYTQNSGRWPKNFDGKNVRVALKTSDVRFDICVYGQFLCDQLIERIKRSAKDPIEEVYKLYSMLDEVLGDSADDHFVTHRFAAIMEHQTGNILRYLQSNGQHD